MTKPKELHDHVAASMEAFEPMLPTLTGYARAMTGKPDIRVIVGGMTMTDGVNIAIRPPLALSEPPDHQRKECGRRTENGTLTCPSCRLREDILVKVRHEIGHIAHGSLRPFACRQETLTDMAAAHGLPSATISSQHASKHLVQWGQECPDTNIATLVLILEDVRVDLANSSTSDGGAEIYRTFLENNLTYGPDSGGRGPAVEDPLQMQVLLGMLASPHGVDIEGLLIPEAVAVVRDEKVASLLTSRKGSSRSVLPAAYTLYRRLIDLGIFPEPEKEESDDEETPGHSENDSDTGDGSDDDPGDAGGSAEDDRSGGVGDPDGGTDTDDGHGDDPATGDAGPVEDAATGPAQEDEDAPSPDVAEQAGEGPSPKDLQEAIEAATGHDIDLDGGIEALDHVIVRAVKDIEGGLEHLGEYRPHVGGVKVFGRRRPDGRGPLLGESSTPKTKSACDPSEPLLGALVGRARTVFQSNIALKRQQGLTRGRVSPTLLGKRAWNSDDQRLFERRWRKNAPSYSVLIGMDNSGSTEKGARARILRETVLAAATMCQRVGVQVSIYAHTTGMSDLTLDEIKAPSDPWGPRIAQDLRGLGLGYTNYDGSTMTAYRRILASTTANRKVLLYFTDGEIPGSGGKVEAQIMRDEVKLCQRQGITLLGVGVETSSPEKFGIPTIRLDHVNDTGRVLEFLAKEFGI